LCEMQRKTRNEECATSADEERKTRDAGTMCRLWNQAQFDPARVSGETLALFFGRSRCDDGIYEEMVGSKTCQ